jgi:hypothetical protein
VPAGRGGFTVDLGPNKNPEATTVVVLDQLGRPVHRQAFGPTQALLPVTATLAPGIYLVQVRRGPATATQKLVVQ